jgi:hypothetical protein
MVADYLEIVMKKVKVLRAFFLDGEVKKVGTECDVSNSMCLELLAGHKAELVADLEEEAPVAEKKGKAK